MPAERFLDGRHAVVTGGSRGIGRAVAHALARAGATVTITGRNVESLAAAATELRARHDVAVLELTCDVTDDEAVRSAFERAAATHGDPYVLVNNAGAAEGADFMHTTRALWDHMIAANLTSAFTCTQQVIDGMLRLGGGRIVNIASVAGLQGARNITAYTAAKHGVVGLTRALALELVRKAITVNAVCPGYTDTEMSQRTIGNLAQNRGITKDEARAMIARTIPRGTLITPDEVADTVLWLCSPGASAITGQAIAVAAGEL